MTPHLNKTAQITQFDPRTIADPVYETLRDLREKHQNNVSQLKEQRSQAVELYTYLSTWGLMRLKAEERALRNQAGKQEIITAFFKCLQKVSGVSGLADDSDANNVRDIGLETLKKTNGMGLNEYLGLTNLGLLIAQEFSFWATAIYADLPNGNMTVSNEGE